MGFVYCLPFMLWGGGHGIKGVDVPGIFKRKVCNWLLLRIFKDLRVEFNKAGGGGGAGGGLGVGKGARGGASGGWP